MAIVCKACGAWIVPVIDVNTQTARCPDCNFVEPRRFLPLFVVTGTSGVGKTAIVPELQQLLPNWDIFETDILQDSGGDWQMVKCNWLRIAHNLAQSNRPVILCGTIKPDELDRCETRPFFTTIYYLALHCDETTQAKRLRARPAWRGWTEEKIATHQWFAQWFIEHADSCFEPPLTIINTNQAPPREVAQQICQWAISRWNREQSRGKI